MIWPKWLFEYNLYSFYKAVDDNLFFYFYNHTWKSIDLPIEFFLVQIDKYLASQFWQFMLLNMIKNKKKLNKFVKIGLFYYAICSNLCFK